MATIKLPVSGMSCASCVGRVEDTIAAVATVEGVNVNLATEIATVSVTDTSTLPAVTDALEVAGYPVLQGVERFSIQLSLIHI